MSIDKAIAAASLITDADAANKAWGAIDKQIMEQAACVPDYHSIRNWMHGTKVGGFVYDQGNMGIALTRIYAKA